MMHRSLLLLAFLGALSACATPDQDIEGEDDDPLQASLRFIFPTQPEYVPAEGEAPLETQTRSLVELSGDFATGDFDEDNTGIPTDYVVWQANVASRWNFRLRDVFQFDLLAGVSYGRIDLDYDVLGMSVDRHEDGFGPLLGLELAWFPVDRLAVYGRTTYAVLIPESASGQAEAGVRLELFRGLHAFGGYRYWRFRHEGGSSSASDIDLELTGFLFGAELRF